MTSLFFSFQYYFDLIFRPPKFYHFNFDRSTLFEDYFFWIISALAFGLVAYYIYYFYWSKYKKPKSIQYLQSLDENEIIYLQRNWTKVTGLNKSKLEFRLDKNPKLRDAVRDAVHFLKPMETPIFHFYLLFSL